METRKILDANGDYHGVAVVDNLVITEVGSPFPNLVPTCNVVRRYINYPEDQAFDIAKGFIEGYERSEREQTVLDYDFTGKAKDHMGPVTNSTDLTASDISSPPPWEQGMNSRGSKPEWEEGFFPKKKSWWRWA